LVYWYTGFGLNANTTQPLGINCKLQTAKGLMLDAMLTHIKTFSNMFYKIDQTILLAQLLVGIKVYMCTVVDWSGILHTSHTSQGNHTMSQVLI
jgi:hypothetical protein